MLAREFRIAADKDIKRILKLGKRLSCPECTLYFVPNTVGHPRVCVVVAAGVSKRAVVRNRVKRQAREVLRVAIQNKELSHAIDIVLMIRQPAAKIIDGERPEVFKNFFIKTGLFSKQKQV